MMDEEVVLIDIFTPLREDFCDPCLDLTIELLSSPALTGLGVIAVALGDAGAVACHGNTHSPDATCQRIKQAHPLTGDLSEPQTAKHLVEQTIDHFGRLDILINNAGIIRRAPAVEYSDDDWARCSK